MEQGLFNKTKDILSMCDGYHQACKGLHWGADKHSIHILTDDIDSSVLEYQDKIAECVMGLTGNKFTVGDIKTLVPDAKELKPMLSEMESDVLSYRGILSEKQSGLINILDDFLTDINKWKYLSTLS